MRKKVLWRQRQRVEWCCQKQRNTGGPPSIPTASSHSLWKEQAPADTLISDFRLPKYWENKYLLFQATEFGAICCSSPENSYKDLDSFDEYYQKFCKISFSLSLSGVFSRFYWDCRFWEGYQRDEGHVIHEGAWYLHDFNTDAVHLDYSRKVVSVRFLHCKVTIFPFSHSIYEKQVTESTYTQNKD